MREICLIKSAIKKFDLKLNGLTVLTEAASNNFIWTPIIAAKAGAQVIAYSKTSKHGKFDEIAHATMNYSKRLNVENRVEVFSKLLPEHINTADIITNLGFIRPINKSKIRYFKSTAVISLMWETWEFRERDIDIQYCYKREIPVLGVNESDPRLKTMDYLGAVAKKILFEAGIEVFQSRIGVVGKGKFADVISRSLLADGAICQKLQTFSGKELNFIAESDALIISDHETETIYIARNGLMTPKRLRAINPNIIIVHITGGINDKEVLAENIKLYPPKIAPLYSMSVTTGYVGPKPVIDLHTAGLKVGEELTKARRSGYDYESSIRKALNNPICQDFSISQKKLFNIKKQQKTVTNNNGTK